jgi:hypothetical protein
MSPFFGRNRKQSGHALLQRPKRKWTEVTITPFSTRV